MKQNSFFKIMILFLLFTMPIVLTMVAVVPFLSKMFSVEVSQNNLPQITEAPAPGKPEELLITALYEMEEKSKKITAVYIEVFSVKSNTVAWFEIPADTKVNLSEDLYKSLQTYAPELPQYFKVSNMAESFSEEYGLTGCNRILSEVLGVTVNEYVRVDKKSLMKWSNVLSEEKKTGLFFEDYSKWLAESSASLTRMERWTYYESLLEVKGLLVELAPGSREKDGYLISGKRSRERLQELMLRTKELPE